MDKENEVKDLERRIWDMLDSERLENEEKIADHEREWKLTFDENQKIVEQIAITLKPE
jgi:hypothetical protein